MSKFSKQSGDLPPLQLRQARKKIASIVAELRKKGQEDTKLFQRARHWIDVESKSHWDKMNQGQDVSELVKKIGISAADIVWDYNVSR